MLNVIFYVLRILCIWQEQKNNLAPLALGKSTVLLYCTVHVVICILVYTAKWCGFQKFKSNKKVWCIQLSQITFTALNN